jgi:hypothetical protein
MFLGEFERAWGETDRIESRRHKGFPVKGQLVWDGRDFTNRVVLLRNDHGLGDTIQFIRYAPLIRERCRRLIVKARPVLLPLLRTFECIDDVIPAAGPDPLFDLEIECTELPYIFRTTVDTIPRDIPYIRINGAATRNSSRGGGRLRVGLVWASGPWNDRRSLQLTDLRPLSTIPHVSFRSLQWGPEWIQAQNPGHGLVIRNTSAAVREDLIETAAAIMRCNVVLTVDTMVAHLAGALAKPVWVLLHVDSDWRWMLDRTDSPWYPTMTLFRQPSRGDWSAPVQEVAKHLKRFVAG